jgi:micrococcal nuclease
MTQAYYYNCTVVKIVDGDTIDVDIDLGFSVTLKKQRLRLAGIDTPESRTRNKAEKVLGLAAKERVIELVGGVSGKILIQSLGTGKYGRILAIPLTLDGVNICATLINEGHAVEYWGGKKTKKWA